MMALKLTEGFKPINATTCIFMVILMDSRSHFSERTLKNIDERSNRVVSLESCLEISMLRS